MNNGAKDFATQESEDEVLRAFYAELWGVSMALPGNRSLERSWSGALRVERRPSGPDARLRRKLRAARFLCLACEMNGTVKVVPSGSSQLRFGSRVRSGRSRCSFY